MTSFLNFLYEQYIKAYIDKQPMDDGDTFRYSLLDTSLEEKQREDLDAVLRYNAVHAFLLGMQAGRELR